MIPRQLHLKIWWLVVLSLLALPANSRSVAQDAQWNQDGRTSYVDNFVPTSDNEQGYSFSVWVKLDGEDPNFPSIASTKNWEQGEIIDLLSSRNMGKTLKTGGGAGWTIAIQPNGAWTWNIGDGKKQRLDYIPTAQRQTVTDNRWHLLAFTVNKSKTAARLFFDGRNVAIYSINWFAPGAFKECFIVGGDRRSDSPDCGIYGSFESAKAFDRQLTDQEVFELYQRRYPDAVLPAFEQPVTELKVMSWNIWHGARHPGIEKGVNQAINFIKHADPDIITMQETYGSGPTIADRLGYYFYQRSDNLSVMSKFPIEQTHPLYRALWFGGATIRLSPKQKINTFCLWINHLPAWRRDSQKEDASEDSLVEGEWKTRAREMKDILAELKPFIDSSDEVPLLVGGDFNSPSMLDWGNDTKQWHNDLVVKWPVSQQMLDHGFQDAYREIHPDPTKHTHHELWNSDAKRLTYRIDYLYTRGKPIQVTDARMFNIHQAEWASDHPAVMATYQLKNPDESTSESQAPLQKAFSQELADADRWDLIWSDEFNESDLDSEKWTRCKRGRPAWRDTMSDDPRVLLIDEGVLHLRGIENDRRGDDPSPYLTGGITSRGKFDFQYGKIQIRARFKSAQGAWPALWMLGTGKGWLGKGEIDLMEHLNFDHQVYQTVHSFYTLNIDKTNTPKRYVKAKIKRDDWNTYGCEWNQDQIVFTVNGKPTHTYPKMPSRGEKQWSFDQPFYLILSMQIGGSWVNGSGPTNPEHYPAGMEIDWVRVYQSKNKPVKE